MSVTTILNEKLLHCRIYWKNFTKIIDFKHFSFMSKVFTDFSRTNFMKRGFIIGIPVIIAIIIGISVLAVISNQNPNKMEVEDTLDREIVPGDSPEIDKKLDEIKKIANETEYVVLPRDWQTSGPFQIDRTQYALGEKIFLRIGALKIQDKGEIAVMRPLNKTHDAVYLTIPFDGTQKNAFNYYLDPQLSKARKLCSVNDILGKWSLVFRGTNYPNLNFEIINKTVPGTNWDPVC